MHYQRLSSIDLLKTIAIIIMIIANSSPYILVSPHSIYTRIISSLAAPLFIFLSGFSFFLSFNKNQNYRNKYFQVFYLFCSAILLDITIWHIMPFQTFDVLYLSRMYASFNDNSSIYYFFIGTLDNQCMNI